MSFSEDLCFYRKERKTESYDFSYHILHGCGMGFGNDWTTFGFFENIHIFGFAFASAVGLAVLGFAIFEFKGIRNIETQTN